MSPTTSLQRTIFDSVQPSGWRLPEIAGRLVEISSFRAPASLSLAFSMVLEAQRQREPVGWATSVESFFYPPDAAQTGIDLAALVVVRVPKASDIPRAGEKLLRSGGFGLVVLDLGVADIPMPLQSRLIGLAQRHHAALVCLTEKEKKAFSLGSLVSWRCHGERRRVAENRFACAVRVLKDKRRGPTWTHEEVRYGPPGLC
jgi:recombination protein RecA